MAKLPMLRAKDLTKVLARLGFQMQRQKGSHMFFRHPDGRTTLVPHHPGEELDRGLLAKIIKHDLEMERDEFLRQLSGGRDSCATRP